MSKPGSNLRALFDVALRSMQDDGTIDRLKAKWFWNYKTSP